MSDPRLDAIRAAAHAELRAAPKARAWWLDGALFAGVVLLLAGGGLAMFSWHDVQHLGAVSHWGGFAVLLGVTYAAGMLGLKPGGSVVARWGVLGISLVAGAVLLVTGSGVGSQIPLSATVGCAAIECAMAVMPLFVAGLVLSRFAFDALRAALLGLAAGAPGLVVLHLHCTNGGLGHLALMHVLPWFVVSGLCLVLRRALPTRSYAP